MPSVTAKGTRLLYLLQLHVGLQGCGGGGGGGWSSRAPPPISLLSCGLTLSLCSTVDLRDAGSVLRVIGAALFSRSVVRFLLIAPNSHSPRSSGVWKDTRHRSAIDARDRELAAD